MKNSEKPADKVREIVKRDLCTPDDECIENVIKFRKNPRQASLY